MGVNTVKIKGVVEREEENGRKEGERKEEEGRRGRKEGEKRDAKPVCCNM